MGNHQNVTGGYPPIGVTHNNGDRIFGYTSGYARDLLAAGTPNVSGLPVKYHTPEMRNVRIGDRLAIRFHGTHWEAERNGVPVGRLDFSVKQRGQPVDGFEGRKWDHDEGVLIIERVKVSAEGDVVNCGGTAYPLGHSKLR